MKRMVWCLVVLLCGSVSCVRMEAASSRTPQVIAVTQPTVIAFFPAGGAAAADGESLEDFQFYVRQDGKQLRREGIRVEENYAGSFRLRVGGAVKTVRPEGGQAGYYFIAPGRAPKLVYGVTTDDELLQMAAEYFGKPLL